MPKKIVFQKINRHDLELVWKEINKHDRILKKILRLLEELSEKIEKIKAN